MAANISKLPKRTRKSKNPLSPEKKEQLVKEYMNGKISQRDIAIKYETSKTEVQRLTAGMKQDSPVKRNNQTTSLNKETVNNQNENGHSEIVESDTESKSEESLQNFSTLDEIAEAAGYRNIDEKIDIKHDRSSSGFEENPEKKIFDDVQMIENDTSQYTFSEKEDIDLVNHFGKYVKHKINKQHYLVAEIDKEKKLREDSEAKLEKLKKQAQKLLADNQLLQSELEKSKSREKKLNAQLADKEKPKKVRNLCVNCGNNAKLKYCTLPFCSHECASNVYMAFTQKHS